MFYRMFFNRLTACLFFSALLTSVAGWIFIKAIEFQNEVAAYYCLEKQGHSCQLVDATHGEKSPPSWSYDRLFPSSTPHNAVGSVFVAGDELDSNTWSALQSLPYLRFLHIQDCRNDQTVYEIPEFPYLDVLIIHNTDLSNQQAEGLLKSSKLSHLEASKSGLFPRYFDRLNHMENLEILSISDELIDSSSLHKIKIPDSVKSLSISHIPINPLALIDISRLHYLESIEFSHTNISDGEIPKLLPCQKLTSVFLSGTQITKACLPILAKLPNLRILRVDDTRIPVILQFNLRTATQNSSQLHNILINLQNEYGN